MKLADKILHMLDEGLSLSKRVNLIKKEVESKSVSRGELLGHLSSLERLLDHNPKSKTLIRPIIKKAESKLSRPA
ncbi:hypothetical protein [Bacteriovorax sp. Seq25_V]|uniref:hypothetical protein n=1 Tax=Bacteriovorax sp. Seq25_V TaxID=1201288 RepID=UPI000389FB18|nr:hypothetical protein [Bacteriovorax sp. Seq25_V]EQC43276.1 hypothetical protein M900_0123 [Bacteriovorax sp. Seq25_V]